MTKFEIALEQRLTIDANKCEKFGPFVQGFFAVKKDNDACIIPFVFYSEATLKKVKEAAKDYDKDTVGISFAQHYIHYTQ